MQYEQLRRQQDEQRRRERQAAIRDQERRWRDEGLDDDAIERRWEELRVKQQQEAKERAERQRQLDEEQKRERAKNTLANNVNSYGLFGLATWAVRGVAAGLSEAMKEAAAKEAPKAARREAAARKPAAAEATKQTVAVSSAASTVTCPRCGRSVASSGLGNHLASCQAGEWERAAQQPRPLTRSADEGRESLTPSPLKEAVQLSCEAHEHYRQQRYAEAKPLYERALAIYARERGPDHGDTVIARSFLAEVEKECSSAPLQLTVPPEADNGQRGWNGTLPEVPHARHDLPIDDQWYVWTQGLLHPEGPLSKKEMIRRIDSGELRDEAFCWHPRLAAFRCVSLVRQDGKLGPQPPSAEPYHVLSQRFDQLVAKKIPVLFWVEAGRLIENPSAEDIRLSVQKEETLILGLGEYTFMQCTRITYEEPYCYSLEFQNGSVERQYEAVDGPILADRVADAMCKYLRRDLSWRSDFRWKRVALNGGPVKTAGTPPKRKATKNTSKATSKKKKKKKGGNE